MSQHPTTDIIVDLLDGRSLSLPELSMETGPFWILAYDILTKMWLPAQASHCRLISTKKEGYLVSLSNGQCIRLAGDQKLMARHNRWIRVDQLEHGMSLKAYDRVRNVDGYDVIYSYFYKRYRPLHRLVAEWKLGPYIKGLGVYHWNNNASDNRPTNLITAKKTKQYLPMETPAEHTEDARWLTYLLKTRDLMRFVESVSQIGPMDVYTINVPKYKNFPLTTGVVLHT